MFIFFSKKDIAMERVYLECQEKRAAVIFVLPLIFTFSLQDN